jgi:hypothetical protein
MRLFHAAALTAAALLLGSLASAQGLGDAAAKEKQKRKTSPKTAKVYTDDNIGRSMAPVSSSDQAAPAAGQPSDKPAADAAAADKDKAGKEKPAEDPKIKAQAEWLQKLEQARKEESSYQDMVIKLQTALNDTSALYNSGRAANVALLEENQKKLAEVKTRIASLEEEGRRNGYR